MELYHVEYLLSIVISSLFYSSFIGMALYSDHDLWVKEQTFLTEEKKRIPNKFILTEQKTEFLLHRVGINRVMTANLPKGYIKYSPLDFIVEEILLDGSIITVDTIEKQKNIAPISGGVVYADVIKVGISTLDVVQRIAKTLAIDISQIGYAGIKDGIALTGQMISIRGITIDKVKNLSIKDVIFKNIREGSGDIKIGTLQGNRFTLFIRTEKEINHEEFMSSIDKIKRDGVVNYYGPQRFGAPRYLSHLFGLYLFCGDNEGLLRSYFFDESPFEFPYIREIRRKAVNHFGNWKAIKEIFGILPYTFRTEVAILEELEKTNNPKEYGRALGVVSQQVDFWPKSYASYLANKLLSDAATGKIRTGDELPLVLSLDGANSSIYRDLLRDDGVVGNFIQNLRKFPFIKINKRLTIKSRIKPIIHGVRILPEGVVLSFDLPKGAYATTMLMSLFNIVGDIPLPEWLNTKDIDIKEVLDLGSSADIKARLSRSVDLIIAQRGKELLQ